MRAVGRRICETLRSLGRSEQGIALPVAIMATAIGLIFAAVVVTASVHTQSGDVHSHAGDVSLSASNAGLNIAVLRQNQLATSSSSCVQYNESAAKLEVKSVPSSGWCEAVKLTEKTSPPSPPGTEVEYQVKPACKVATTTSGTTTTTKTTICVVATGRSPGASSSTVEHRSKLEATSTKTVTAGKASEPVNPFSFGEIAGIESLYLVGNSQVFHGGAASNGQVQIIDSSKVCGGLRYGPGTLAPVGREEQVKWVYPESERPYSNGTGGGVCTGEKPTTGTEEYQSVSLPTNIATENSDARITKKEDKSGETNCNYCNIGWNASNRELSINYSTFTLGGSLPYYLCKFTLTGGSTLYAGTGKTIRIFFDEPKNCPGLNGSPQLTINGGTKVEADSGHGPGFYLLGSSTSPSTSKVYFGNGAASANLVIYAPNSAVEVAGGINLNGAILGRTLKLEGGANVNPNAAWVTPSPEEYLAKGKATAPVEEVSSFSRSAYVECSPKPTTAGEPSSGC
jgi:hypothetical protein